MDASPLGLDPNFIHPKTCGDKPPSEPRKWLSPQQAAAFLGCSPDELVRFVTERRIRVHRLPSGPPIISSAELVSLPEPVQPEDAGAFITNAFSEENPMRVESHVSATTPDSDLFQRLLCRFNEAVETVRRAATRNPLWLDIADAVSLFGAPAKTIKKWAREGYVRCSKLGPTFQSKALYNAEDLNAVLNRIAAGKTPIVALREAR